MPPMKIVGSLSTKPFASDDLHVLCLLNGTYRLMQLVFIVPLWIYLYVHKFVMKSDTVPAWCPEAQSDSVIESKPWEPEYLPHHQMNDTLEKVQSPKISFWMSVYLWISVFFIVANLFLLAAIWSASSIGTPTQPMGREKFLRPLLQTRTFAVSILQVIMVFLGIALVEGGRSDNWGCEGEYAKGGAIEGTGWYTLLSATIMMQAIEVFFLPAIIVAKAVRWLRKNVTGVMKKETRGKSLDSCLTGCLKCCGFLCCGKKFDMENAGEMRDAAEAVLDFFSRSVPYTWSDLYVSLHMVSRVQQVQRLNTVREALLQSRRKLQKHPAKSYVLLTGTSFLDENGEETIVLECLTGEPSHISSNRRNEMTKRRSVVFSRKTTDQGYYLGFRKVLDPDNPDDIMLIQKATRYAKHSNAVYDDLLHFMESYLKAGMDAAMDGGQVWLDGLANQPVHMDEIGFEQTELVYSNFVNSISKTPYYIVVDEGNKEIIVSIRGTASLEDAVIDLQLTPVNLRDVGKKCGFDGEKEFCHKGVLTRCIWIYEDLRSHGVLDKLIGGEEPRYPDYDLIVTGHSLGAGCAAVLSCMIKKQFPDLRCYAFCPPGGLVSEGLAKYSEDFVTSFINNADIIPRMSLSNMEKLRDECLEVLARIKVSKFQLFRALRLPCSDGALGAMNDLLLYPPEETPRDTTFYKTLEAHREKVASFSTDVKHTLLFPPGRILNMIRTENTTSNTEEKESLANARSTFTPQWAERTDFNEIVVSASLLEDHSMDKVLESLENIFDLLSNPSSKVPLQIDVIAKAAELELDERDLMILTNRNFICCSRPHGNLPMLTATLSSVAFALTLISNNYCAFVERSTEWLVAIEDGANADDSIPGSYQGIGLAMGLFSFEQKYYDGEGDRSDPTSYIPSGVCSRYPSWFVADSWLRGARACGSFASLMGATAVAILWASGCHRYKRKHWRLGWIFSVLAFVFQGLVFILVFNAELCNVYEINEGSYEILLSAECERGRDANMAIGAMVIWFLTILLAFRYPDPNF